MRLSSSVLIWAYYYIRLGGRNMAIFNKINLSQDFLNANWFSARFLNNLGCKVDIPDEKDWKFSISPIASTPLIEDVDLSKWGKEISNQGLLGSCSSNACSDGFELQYAHKNNLDPSKVENISRLFVYYNARNLENPPETNTDSGSRIKFNLCSMSLYGACPEKLWEYDISKFNIRPAIIAYREAIKHRISAFYRIDKTGEDRILQVKQALSAGNIIIFGTKLSNSYRSVSDETVIFPPTGSYIGSHAQLICGWSSAKKAFKIRNSWGIEWGFGGFCYMAPEYIKADITRDLWVITI